MVTPMGRARSFLAPLILLSALAVVSTSCIDDPADLEAIEDPDDPTNNDDNGCDDPCGDEFCIEGQCTVPTSCRHLVDAGVAGDSGTYLIDPPGNDGEPFEAHCDFDADSGAGYTMVRLEGGDLENEEDVEVYRQTCQAKGMELIVPRTRAHAESILDVNDDTPPNVVGVYRQFPDAPRLHNWAGRCQGQPCSFYISDNPSAGCGELQPDGSADFDTPLIRTDDDCFFGTWEDRAEATLEIPGSVLCSTNDAGPPLHETCLDYRLDDSVHNAGPRGISGVYTLSAGDGPPYPAYCDMSTLGGGWTLAMKIDGEQPTFHYNSPLWENDQLLNPDSPDLDREEAKLQSFVDLPFTQLLVGLEGPDSDTFLPDHRYLPLPVVGDSLYDLFVGGDYVATQVGREAWKNTMADSSLQWHCNHEGLNSRTTEADSEFARARVGIIGNNEDDCSSPDSRIGLGTAGDSCGQQEISAGNAAACGGDEGDQNVAATGALMVRDVPLLESCQALQEAGITRSGVYPIAPDGDEPFNAYCEMDMAGGGWTLVALHGFNDRPQRWWGNHYPRPGASHYGDIGRVQDDIARLTNGQMNIDHHSIDAAQLFDASSGEVLAYVGGETTDFITADLPQSCNFFDGDAICEHNTYTGLQIVDSDGSLLTDDGQACTTGRGLIQDDPFDEFGLHLLVGTSNDAYHCANTDSQLGQGGIGRLYTTFNSSNGDYWDSGVLNHWNTDAGAAQPGALFMR